MAGRDDMRTVFYFLRKGTFSWVTRIDRLARRVGNLQGIVGALNARGVSLKALSQPNPELVDVG